MTESTPARRIYDAACVAAEEAWHSDSAPELLLRIGLPGLAQRLGFARTADVAEGFHRLQKLSHTLLYEAATAVSAELTAAGIQHFFVKGIALIHRFYEPGDRSMSDMDIYIQEDAREATLQVLKRLEYAVLPDADQAGPAEMRTALALRRNSASVVEQHVVDLHWSLDPVERILPRRDRPVPDRIWASVVTNRPVPAPHPEHHAVMLAHHLVHTDLLHVRNLLDFAYEFSSFPEDGGSDYLAVCRELRIGRFGAFLARLMAREFGISRQGAEGYSSAALGRLEREITPERWLTLTARSHPHDDEVVTLSRVRRRLKLLDSRAIRTLLNDVLFPPDAFLRWRWSDCGLRKARWKHYGQVAKKAWRW